MSKLFLSLDNAVLMATKKFDIDPEYARQELKQKCYITDDQYTIGYHDGLYDAIEAIEAKAENGKCGE